MHDLRASTLDLKSSPDDCEPHENFTTLCETARTKNFDRNVVEFRVMLHVLIQRII